MHHRSERTHLGCGIEWIANPDGRRELEKSVEEPVGDLFVQQQARARNTRLSLVVKNGEGAAADSGGQVGVVENNIGALATELSCTRLRLPAEASTILRPVAVDPVNAIF